MPFIGPLLMHVYYNLFHQILGVAFFQFARSIFEKFLQKFSRSIFSSSELDQLVCNRILVVKESCNFDNSLHDLTSLIHQKNPPNFQGCWGKNKIGKRLLSGSGETDCRVPNGQGAEMTGIRGTSSLTNLPAW